MSYPYDRMQFGTLPQNSHRDETRDRPTVHERLSPRAAGCLVGFVAGPIALSVARLAAGNVVEGAIAQAAAARDVSIGVSVAIAYVTAASLGALIGAGFAVVTRFLHRWLALALWAMVFFVCAGIVVVTAPLAHTLFLHGGSVPVPVSTSVLSGALVFGLCVSFSLPIRRRR
jgi:hypothetical protein